MTGDLIHRVENLQAEWCSRHSGMYNTLLVGYSECREIGTLMTQIQCFVSDRKGYESFLGIPLKRVNTWSYLGLAMVLEG